jgi:hypothetical protein
MIHPRVVFSVAALLFASHAPAQTPGDTSLAPLYDGDHAVSAGLRLAVAIALTG